MIGNNKHKDAGQNLFLKSVFGLANIAAAAIAFLVTPPAYGKSIDWVQSYTAQHYGAGLEDLVAFGWFVICALFIFFLSRATLSTLIIMGGLALATRMF